MLTVPDPKLQKAEKCDITQQFSHWKIVMFNFTCSFCCFRLFESVRRLLYCHLHASVSTLCLKKNVLTLKRYSSKLQGAILMKFGRNIQNTLE